MKTTKVTALPVTAAAEFEELMLAPENNRNSGWWGGSYAIALLGLAEND